MTVMEAMQAGVPVVATDVGSVREAVDDGDTGLIVPRPGDVGDDAAVDAMVAALARLRDDVELRASMGDRAREVGRVRFDATAAVASWEALYERVLAGVSRP